MYTNFRITKLYNDAVAFDILVAEHVIKESEIVAIERKIAK